MGIPAPVRNLGPVYGYADQLSDPMGPAPAMSGRRLPTWNSLRNSPVATSEKNIFPVSWTAAGCQGRATHCVVGGQPEPNDSSTQFATVPSLLNIAEWKKSIAPGMFPVPPELNSSSATVIGLDVSGIPFVSISHT